MLATTARLTGGDLTIAEDATADAFVSALQTWDTRGVPDRPGAWLTTAHVAMHSTRYVGAPP